MKNKLPWFRDVLTFSVLLFCFVFPAVYSAQEAGRFQLSPPALQTGALIELRSVFVSREEIPRLALLP